MKIFKTWEEAFGNKELIIKCNDEEEFTFACWFVGFGRTPSFYKGYAVRGTNSDNYGFDSLTHYSFGYGHCEKVEYQDFFFSVSHSNNMEVNTEVKPPLGVIPKKYWIANRKKDLARAICEYVSTNTACDELTNWINELKELNDDKI